MTSSTSSNPNSALSNPSVPPPHLQQQQQQYNLESRSGSAQSGRHPQRPGVGVLQQSNSNPSVAPELNIIPPQAYAQPYLSHLPPPYAPLGDDSRVPIDPSLLPSSSNQGFESHPQNRAAYNGGLYPSVMVYPPPPPPPGNSVAKQEPVSFDGSQGRQKSSQLPSMGSWAPPSGGTNGSEHSSPGWMQNQHPGQAPFPHQSGKENRGSKRRPSDAEEVEAGIALAGMGMGLPPGQLKREIITVAPAKKAKKEEAKKGEKDNKKSCSECRRLKAKCDRQFPCSNCRRRGCALVCPDGDLSCMQGKRLVLASTEQLHERIAQLEAALSQAHSKSSNTNHPLLAPQYLDGGFAAHPAPLLDETLQTLKAPNSPPNRKPVLPEDQVSPKDRSSASSHLVLTPKLSSERSSSQGRMAVESLLLNGATTAAEGKREDEWVGENAPPAMIIGNINQDQTADANEHQIIVERLRDILRILPPREETRRRAESFWASAGWYNTMLYRQEFENVYEPAVYAPTSQNPLSPHKLAVVLMVLTLTVYFDLSADEDNPAVAEYWEGAQRCFDTRFGWAASVAGVQALALATLFVGFGWRGARASNFYWLRMMTSAALQIGLHKDPHSSLPEDEREFRRRVFWDCYTIDCLMSVNHGQRTAVSLENIETLLPTTCPPLNRMKYEYMRSVKSAVIEIGCRPDTAPASWDQILATEQLLRQYDVKNGPHLHCPILSDKTTPPLSIDPPVPDNLALTRSTTSLCHFKAMMFLYRPSLRRLISRLRSHPHEAIAFSDEDRQTVSMTYNACHAITAISLYMSRTHPRLSARFWSVWVQTFSAAVSMTALAIWCGPHLEPTFITSAYTELNEACEMIRENGCKRSRGVLALLPILQSLVHNRYPQLVGKDPATANISVEGEDMLFALLGGQVDQSGVSPKQGILMNPSMVVNPNPPSAPPLHTVPAKGPAKGNQARGNNTNANGAAAQPLAQQHVETGYQAMWNEPMQMALPVVVSHPSASPIDTYPMHFPISQPANNHQQQGHAPQQQQQQQQRQQQQQQQQQHQPGPPQNQQSQPPMLEGMNNDDLWLRLQAFYEPSTSYWGQSVGSMGGYVDYGMVGTAGGMS